MINEAFVLPINPSQSIEFNSNESIWLQTDSSLSEAPMHDLHDWQLRIAEWAETLLRRQSYNAQCRMK